MNFDPRCLADLFPRTALVSIACTKRSFSLACTEALTCNPGFQVLSPVDLLRRHLRPEGMNISLRVFPLPCKYTQCLREERRRQPWSKWPQMIKNNRESPAGGRGGGESCSRTRADIGTYCPYWQYLMAKCKKLHLQVFFFPYLRLLYWLINLFYSFKKMTTSIFDIPESFFKYPVSLKFFTQISR